MASGGDPLSGAGCPGSPPAEVSCCGPPASTADSARPISSTRGRRSRQSRPVASASFSVSTAASSSWSRLRACPDQFLLRSSGARSASSSHRRMRSTRPARSGGQEGARCPAVSAVRTDGSWVLVAVRVACSRPPASASQADLRRDLQIIQPAASPTTSTVSRVQPRAPNPSDSAAAGVPAAKDVGVDVGVRASADVAGVVVGELGRSAEVGVRVEVGVSTLVRGGRVGSTVVSLGDSVPLGAGRVPERSVEGRVAESLPPPALQPLSPRARLSTSPARSRAVVVRHPGIPGSTRIEDHLRIGRGRRGKPARHATRPFFGPRTLPASPEADENGVGSRARLPARPK